MFLATICALINLFSTFRIETVRQHRLWRKMLPAKLVPEYLRKLSLTKCDLSFGEFNLLGERFLLIGL